MRVAFHVDQLWFAAPGGIGTYVRELGPALQAADADLDLVPFASRWGHQPVGMWRAPGGPVRMSAPIQALYPSWALLGRPMLPQALAGCSIVHATNPAAIPPVRQNQRLVVTVHDLAFEREPRAFSSRWRWLYRIGIRTAARRADAILTPSEATAEDLRRLAPQIRPSRIHVTPLAGSLPRSDEDPDLVLKRLGILEPYVLFVGTIESRKNLVALIRAYITAKENGVPHDLVLAGPEGYGADEVIKAAGGTGPGTVILTGRLPTEDLDAIYARAACLCYPSLYEGFGLPVLEAMSRGVPVIASNTSSIPEVAGDAALLVDPLDEAALAAALVEVLADEATCARLAQRGRERARRFSWEATARATLQVYRELA